MNVQLATTPPATKELAAILKRELSDRYAYQLFGLGNSKSIIVRKSTFVGAQISISEKEITIQGMPPSIPAYFLSFLGLTEFAFIPLIFLGQLWSLPSQWKMLEKEIGAFLKRKYN